VGRGGVIGGNTPELEYDLRKLIHYARWEARKGGEEFNVTPIGLKMRSG